MAKQIDYPRATLKNSLELARAVDDLGGKATIELAADRMEKKVSGAFRALVSAAAKYGLVVSKQGLLTLTPLYREQKLAYSDEEAKARLADAFFHVPLFSDVYARFNGRELPISHFEKLLVREFGVPDQMGSKVSKYFIEGAKQCGLMGGDNVLVVRQRSDANEEEEDSDIEEDERHPQPPPFASVQEKPHKKQELAIASANRYSVRIVGPGMDSTIAVNDSADLAIIEAMLKKVEKKLEEVDDGAE